MSKKQSKSILVIPDLHEPFAHPDAFKFVSAVYSQVKKEQGKSVDYVICLGDEADQHALSRYEADPDGQSPGDEMSSAIKSLKKWYDLFPVVRVCTSNHTVRGYKKAFGAGIPAAFLKSIREVLCAPKGWEWKDNWVVEGIYFQHGEGYSGAVGARNAAIDNSANTVIGHIHGNGGILYHSTSSKTIWGVNSGCLIDYNGYAFRYGKTYRVKPVLGCTSIVNQVPHFHPLVVDSKQKWVGKL